MTTERKPKRCSSFAIQTLFYPLFQVFRLRFSELPLFQSATRTGSAEGSEQKQSWYLLQLQLGCQFRSWICLVPKWPASICDLHYGNIGSIDNTVANQHVHECNFAKMQICALRASVNDLCVGGRRRRLTLSVAGSTERKPARCSHGDEQETMTADATKRHMHPVPEEDRARVAGSEGADQVSAPTRLLPSSVGGEP